jgi:hypothetical protein
MSRQMVDAEKRKSGLSVSMDMDTQQDVLRIGVGKTFSEKLSNIVQRMKLKEGVLVEYSKDDVNGYGYPTVINRNAVCVFSRALGISEFTEDETLLKIAPVNAKQFFKTLDKTVTVIDTVERRFKDSGYVTQKVVDDENGIYTLWVRDPNKASPCDRCVKLERLYQTIDEIRG